MRVSALRRTAFNPRPAAEATEKSATILTAKWCFNPQLQHRWVPVIWCVALRDTHVFHSGTGAASDQPIGFFAAFGEVSIHAPARSEMACASTQNSSASGFNPRATGARRPPATLAAPWRCFNPPSEPSSVLGPHALNHIGKTLRFQSKHRSSSALCLRCRFDSCAVVRTRDRR